jgi:pimeloyl-ACP methyl ester carboxylesterase
MYQAMKQVSFPIDSEEKRVVCIGHSAGGQLCRYYAEADDLKSIKGIFLLDSMPVNRWAVLIAQNTSADEKAAFDAMVSTTGISDTRAFGFPLFLGAAILSATSPKDFKP